MTDLELSRPRLTDLIADCQDCGWSLDLRTAAPSTIMEACREHAWRTGHNVGYSRTVIRRYRKRRA